MTAPPAGGAPHDRTSSVDVPRPVDEGLHDAAQRLHGAATLAEHAAHLETADAGRRELIDAALSLAEQGVNQISRSRRGHLRAVS